MAAIWDQKILLISGGHRQPRPATVLQILREAAKLVWRSWKPLLCIFLILLLPYSFLFVGSYLTITPLTLDMVKKFFAMRSKDPRSPEFLALLAAAVEDLRGITLAEAASVLVSNLLSLLLVMATVYTVAMAVMSGVQVVSLKDVFSRMRRTWKGPVTAWLYVHLLGYGYTTVLLILIGVTAFVSHGSAAVLGTVFGAVFALLLLVYLQVVWNQGLVVSVVEDDLGGGLSALGRASELVRGRRILGFRLSLILGLMAAILVAAYSFVNNLQPPSAETMRLASGLIMLYAMLLLTVFTLASYVVFYYECKKSHGEEVFAGGSLAYTRVPTAEAAPGTPDGAIP